jgi:hypothetical protein
MSAASITQAQNKGLRHFFAEAANAVRDFSVAMYAARDREFAAREANLFSARVATPREKQQGRLKLMSMASECEAHSPSFAAELRHLAGRG